MWLMGGAGLSWGMKQDKSPPTCMTAGTGSKKCRQSLSSVHLSGRRDCEKVRDYENRGEVRVVEAGL